MKKVIIVSVLIFYIICSTYFDSSESLTARVFKVEYGYGYSIFSKEGILIKQEFIPVLQEKKPFCSKNDAKNIADLVLEKLLNKKNPAITLIELEKLQIDINCVDLHK